VTPNDSTIIGYTVPSSNGLRDVSKAEVAIHEIESSVDGGFRSDGPAEIDETDKLLECMGVEEIKNPVINKLSTWIAMYYASKGAKPIPNRGDDRRNRS
jgi:hypothetical protein